VFEFKTRGQRKVRSLLKRLFEPLFLRKLEDGLRGRDVTA
jgi:hypothetical protein